MLAKARTRPRAPARGSRRLAPHSDWRPASQLGCGYAGRQRPPAGGRGAASPLACGSGSAAPSCVGLAPLRPRPGLPLPPLLRLPLRSRLRDAGGRGLRRFRDPPPRKRGAAAAAAMWAGDTSAAVLRGGLARFASRRRPDGRRLFHAALGSRQRPSPPPPKLDVITAFRCPLAGCPAGRRRLTRRGTAGDRQAAATQKTRSDGRQISRSDRGISRSGRRAKADELKKAKLGR